MLRAAPWVALANTSSRNSVKAVVDKRNRPYATSNETGTTSAICTPPTTGVMVSTKFLSSNGTPTLASLAQIMKLKAATTRHLYCHR